MTSEAETMVERIARAIWTSPLLGQPPGYERRRWPPSDPEAVTEVNNQARAALTALLDPTEEMVDAVKPWPAHWAKDGPDFPVRRAAYLASQMTVRSQFRAMIQAALQPEAARRILSETPHAE